MDSASTTNMQRANGSPDHSAADGDHRTSNQQSAPTWTSPPVSRTPPHDLAGKVFRTIFHWVTGKWQHEHEGSIFDWGLLDPVNFRAPCSLPPPPIPKPFTDPTAGNAKRLIFHWKFGQWEHQWENGVRLLVAPGPLAAPVSFVLPSHPPTPPFAPEIPPAHPVYGQVVKINLSYLENLWFHLYEDGTRVGMAIDARYP